MNRLVAILLCIAVVPVIGQDLRQLRARELSQADFEELRIEALQLGLSTSGSRSELERRILEHLGIEPFVPEETADPTRHIEIERAAELQSTSTDEEQAEIVQLTGGVIIRLEDEETGSIHTIEADRITINRRESVVSAGGGVIYTIDRSGDVERFSGETLTLELDNWAGTFLSGTSVRPRTIEGQDFDFRFSGRTISRSADDVILIDDGIITSSVADPPNYRIRARRIWILDTGDWGLRNAVLYVGRVPMFWFPAFFHPGRPMFLHPAIGTRDGDGAFVQTTIYLAGSREERSQPFSVLQLAEDERSGERVREGLFLRPVRDDETFETSESTVRVLADAYSSGAALLAIDARLPPREPWTATTAFAGLGVSRVRFQASDGSVAALYWDGNEFVDLPWSRSMFPGIDVPFRFGLNLETGYRRGPLQLNLQFPLYSDPVFERDFLVRSEFIDWGSIIGFSDEQVTGPSARASLLWRLQGRLNLDVADLRPLVTQASFQTLSAEMQWRRRMVPATELSDEVAAAAPSPFDPPERSFFFPERVVLPNASASIAGTLFQSPSSAPPAAGRDGSDVLPPSRLRPPFPLTPDDGPNFPEDGTDDRQFRLPSARGNLSVPSPADPFAGQVTYRVSPSVSLTGQYLSSPWQVPEDVDYEIEYWEQLRRTQASLNWRASYQAPIVSLQGSTSLSDRYRNVFGFSDQVAAEREENLRQRAFGEHSTVVDNRLTLRSEPLDNQPLLQGSELRYTLDARLMQRRFDSFSATDEALYETEFVGWDRDRIQRHSVQLLSALNVFNARQTLTVGFDLPPRQEQGRSELVLRTGIVQTSGRVAYTADDDTGERTFDPVRLSQSIQAAPRVRFSHQWTYDLEDDVLETGRADIQVSGLTGRLDARRSEGFSFDLENATWTGDGEEQFRPVQASLRYTDSLDPLLFWRNRIRIVPSVQSNASVNFLRFTDSNLLFRLNLELDVHQFLNLRLSSESRNEQLFRYIGPYAEQLGLPRESFFADLARSFNFFNRSDRIDSGFKLRQLRIDAVHDLGDWDLTVGYRGTPEQDGTTVEWRSTVELLLQWRPIPEISRDLTITDDEVTW